jgi:hypothetical protein
MLLQKKSQSEIKHVSNQNGTDGFEHGLKDPKMMHCISLSPKAVSFNYLNLDQYFNTSGPENTTGYFDIIVKHNNKTATGYSRCRIHTTAVETIYLPN